MNFKESPFIVIWETTRSCALKCQHCRAEAIDRRDPNELTQAQGESLLDEVARFADDSGSEPPFVVLTGGDPLRRPDAYDLVAYGHRKGLRMTMTPSGTHEVTREKILRLKEAGLARLAVSLDAASREAHDRFRGVEGSFDWTLGIIRWARELGIPIQINTTITRHNAKDLDAMYALMKELDIVLWSVFFLVPVGRGRLDQEISATEYESVFNRLCDYLEDAPFDIKTTEAPHFRRVVMERAKLGMVRRDGARWEYGIKRSRQGVNSGRGFVFISHTGDIQPSGFLYLGAGNVKTDSLIDVYRHSELFKNLRDDSLLKGKCGVCEYRKICGGSRSRAYSVYGDPLESDPFCAYVPKGYSITPEEKLYW